LVSLPLCLQSWDVPGLVSRLLLLEAVRQPLPHSLLAPGLRDAWQQQQHLDLARVACSSSSRSLNDASNALLPQLAAALLQGRMTKQQQQHPTTKGGQEACSGSSANAYALACVSSPGCRYSLTCWVLAWHAALLQ
jgi:hypothetical protein